MDKNAVSGKRQRRERESSEREHALLIQSSIPQKHKFYPLDISWISISGQNGCPMDVLNKSSLKPNNIPVAITVVTR